jgi:hypothetical protein
MVKTIVVSKRLVNLVRNKSLQKLLRRRAKVDRIADFETKLKQNASRLRTLKYFTGGNPRLALMLYRVVSRSNVTEVRRALEKLLDEVTPLRFGHEARDISGWFLK